MKRSIIIIICVLLLSGSLWGQEVEYVGSALWGWPFYVRIVDDYALCAFPCGLMILDISDPANPVDISKYFLDGWSNNIDISGDYVYICNSSTGFNTIDISNPRQPQYIADFDFVGSSSDIKIIEDHAYLIGMHGFHIVDISDPANPTYVGGIDSLEYGRAVDIAGDYAFAATFYDGVFIIDISEPSLPVVLHRIYTYYYSRDLRVLNDYLYFLDSSGLKIFDVTVPDSPEAVGEFQVGNGLNILVDENYAYITTNNQMHNYSISRIQILDISDPSNPASIAVYPDVEYAWGLDESANNLYVADSKRGIVVIDISAPESPSFVGYFYTPLRNQDVHVENSIACTIGRSSELQIVDVSNSSNPVALSRVDIPAFASDVFINNSHVYVAGDTAGLQIIDITDPQLPNIVAIDSTLDIVRGVFVEGHYVYAIGSGLVILDVTDPANPSVVSNNSNFGGSEIKIVENYAYLFTGIGFKIIDISDPNTPDSVGYFESPYRREFSSFTVNNDYAYIIYRQQFPGNAVMFIVDISNPSSPSLASSYELYYPAGVFSAGSYVYVADRSLGLLILDVSDPSNPDSVISYSLSGITTNVHVDDNLIYLADEFSLMILRFDPQTGIIEEISQIPNQFSLPQNHPNPFNASTTIRYDLPTGSDVTLEIYDILGRKVETLIDGWQPAGAHSIVWDAEGVSSGVYFYRIQAGEFVESRSCLLLK